MGVVDSDEERQRSDLDGADMPPSGANASTDGTTNVTTSEHPMALPNERLTQANDVPSALATEQNSTEMEPSSELSSSQPGARRSLYAPAQKRDSTASDQSGRVGAVDVRMRAYGNRPAWSRNETRNSTTTAPASTTAAAPSTVPPEMRGVVEASTVPPEMGSSPQENPDQSNLPPEMRAIAPPPESASQRDSSELIVAQVSSAPIEAANNKDETPVDGFAKKKMVIYAGMVLVVVMLVVGVAVGVSKGKSSGALPASTDSPTANPTVAAGGCHGYSGLLDDLDLDPTSMSVEVQALYETLLGEASIPETQPEICSPVNAAAVWVANTFAGQDANTQTLSNQLMLATLYFHWNGQGISSTWFETLDECEWTGVTCTETGEIVEISSLDTGVRGESLTLPTEIGLMTDLKSIRLPNSGLSGSIPDTLGALTRLVILDLAGNEAMTGEFSFDTIADLKELRSLSLSKNFKMATELPPSLMQWTNLEVLSLADLSGSSIGSIPSDISLLSALNVLNLSGDGVEGSIDFISTLEQLVYLSVYNGNMVGSVPTGVGSFPDLKWLLLGNNIGLSGPLPPELGGASQIAGVHFLGTQIGDSGTIPRELLTLDSLVSFSATDLEDTVKFTLSELPELKCLDIQTTFLSGSIVSDSASGTCTLELQSGLPVQDGVSVNGCNAMDRATCGCCRNPDDCGPNPLALAQCDAYLRVDLVGRSLEVNLTSQIAIDYVY